MVFVKRNKKLFIVTTSIKSFSYILKNQPAYLNQYFLVYVGSSEPELIKNYAIKLGVKYFPIPMYRKINLFSDIRSIYHLSLTLLKFRPDIIHSYTPKAGLVCAISGYLCRIPTRIHTFTGLIFPYKKPFMRFVLAIIDSLICKLNTHIIAEGQGVKKLLLENKITNKNINIIGNGNIAGVDTKYYNPEKFKHNEKTLELKRYFNINENSITFIFAGRINKDKGIIELLNSYTKSYNENINLIILGEFETKEFELKVNSMIDNSNNKIWLEGWKDDIRPYLFISDCFILPSYREGFPNVLLQAGAMKLPSIVTNVPGSNEIIINNHNGWICNSKSSKDLGILINRVVSMSKSELAKIGIRARKNVEKKYEKTIYQKQLIEFYNQIQTK
jgi:glycosyltransferase involved in cell wall biosynthesis